MSFKPTHKQAMLGALILFIPRNPGSKVVYCGTNKTINYHLNRIYNNVTVISTNKSTDLGLSNTKSNSRSSYSDLTANETIDLLVLDDESKYDKNIKLLIERSDCVLTYQQVYLQNTLNSVKGSSSTVFIRTTNEWLAPKICGWNWKRQGRVNLTETPIHKAELIKLGCRFPLILNWVFRGKPAFTLSTKPSMQIDSILDHIFNSIKKNLGPECSELLVDRLIVSTTMVVVLDIRDAISGKRWIGRVPISSAGDYRCKNNYTALNKLNGKFFGLTTPHICFSGAAGKLFFTVEEALTGKTASDEIDKEGVSRQAADIVTQRANDEGKLSRLSENMFKDVIDPCIERFVSLFDDPGDLRSKLSDMLLKSLGGCTIAIGPVHGDYKLDNLISKAGNIWGVFDCDLYNNNGIMVLDLLHLLVTNKYKDNINNINDMIIDVLMDRKLHKWEQYYIQNFPGDSLFEGTRWFGLVLLYWIDHLGNRRFYNTKLLSESYLLLPDEILTRFSQKIFGNSSLQE